MKTKRFKKQLWIGFLIFLPALGFTQEPVKEKHSITFHSNMTCEGCVETLTKALSFEKGVSDLAFDLEKNLITIEYKNWKTDPQKLRACIEKNGYLAEPENQGKTDTPTGNAGTHVPLPQNHKHENPAL